jgi:hypothetical protein
MRVELLPGNNFRRAIAAHARAVKPKTVFTGSGTDCFPSNCRVLFCRQRIHGAIVRNDSNGFTFQCRAKKRVKLIGTFQLTASIGKTKVIILLVVSFFGECFCSIERSRDE